MFIEFRGLSALDYQKKENFALKKFKFVLKKIIEIFEVMFEMLFEVLSAFPRILFRRRLIFYIIWISLLMSLIYFFIRGLVWLAIIFAVIFAVLTFTQLLVSYGEALRSFELLPKLIVPSARSHETFTDYKGEARMPKKVYVGDSENILLDLQLVGEGQSLIEEVFTIGDNKSGKLVSLSLRKSSSIEQFLEVELQAAAITVDPDKRQSQSLTSHRKLSYMWNCYFPNSGKHAIALAFRVVRSSEHLELGVIQHTIKVVQLANLTQRQVRIIASLAAIAGFIATLVGIIINFPTLLHLFGFP